MGYLKGFFPCGEELSITHQFFLFYDILLFLQASLHEARFLKSILSNFMNAYGTLINGEKSNVFFFNTNPMVQGHLVCFLEFHISNISVKYLGFPLVSNSLRINC